MPAKPDMMIYRKQGQVFHQVCYSWKDMTYLTVKVFSQSQAGAIYATFPLALACGRGIHPSHYSIVESISIDKIEGESVTTNALLKIRNSRTMKADEKRKALDEIRRELTWWFRLAPDEWTKHGRLVR